MHRNRVVGLSFLASLGLWILLAAPSAQAQPGSGTVVVNGVVKDGTAQGWPLYAKLVIFRSGEPNIIRFSDPVTGYYLAELETGFDYIFEVTAVAPGYVTGGGSVDLSSAGQNAVVANWKLFPAPSCNAPGFGPGS